MLSKGTKARVDETACLPTSVSLCPGCAVDEGSYEFLATAVAQ